jgi:uncharacterized LabA/DUF88 family protein
MNNSQLCRIGVFYDGTYFTQAQNYFYRRKLGWLTFQPFHRLVERLVMSFEKNFNSYKIVYAGWYQGLPLSNQANHNQLLVERNRHQDLMQAGIDPKYVPMTHSHGEKGVDVALAVDAVEIGLNDRIDIAVLVSGDGDLVPLARLLTMYGIRVLSVYFKYDDEDGQKSFISERLLRACSYAFNLNSLEHNDNKHWQATFAALFRQSGWVDEGAPATVLKQAERKRRLT